MNDLEKQTLCEVDMFKNAVVEDCRIDKEKQDLINENYEFRRKLKFLEDKVDGLNEKYSIFMPHPHRGEPDSASIIRKLYWAERENKKLKQIIDHLKNILEDYSIENTRLRLEKDLSKRKEDLAKRRK